MSKLTTLELEIVQNTRGSAAKIDELAAALQRLYSASKGASGSAKDMKDEAEAIKNFPRVTKSAVTSVVSVAEALRKVADAAAGVAPSAPDDIKRIGDAIAHVVTSVNGAGDAAKAITSFSNALKSIGNNSANVGEAGTKMMGLTLGLNAIKNTAADAGDAVGTVTEFSTSLKRIADNSDKIGEAGTTLMGLSLGLNSIKNATGNGAQSAETLKAMASGIARINGNVDKLRSASGTIFLLSKALAQMDESAGSAKNIGKTAVQVQNLATAASAIKKLSDSSANLSEANKGIRLMAGALPYLVDSMKGTAKITEQFKEQAGAVSRFASAFAKLGANAINLAAVSPALDEIIPRMQAMMILMQGQEHNVAVFTILAKAIASLARAGVQLTDVTAALNQYNNAVGRAENAIRNATIAGTQIEVLGEKTETTTKSFNRLGIAAGRAAGKIAGIGFKGLMLPLTGLGKVVTSITGRFTKLFNSLKRIAMYRGIRTAIRAITSSVKSGVEHLYEWADLVGNRFKGTMDSLATSAHYVRDSLGAMVAPLLNALAPAVEVLTDRFVELLNTINQTFAFFTGQSTWEKAVRQATEYKDATDDAAGSQKKLNKQLAAFDELNNLTTNEPSSRGKGNKDDNIDADHFTTDTVSVPEWIANIKEAIDNNDWMGAGNALSQHLNEIIGKWDGAAAGEWLGQRVSDALNFINGAVSGFHWDELGQKVAGFIMGIFTTVTPEDVSGAITSTLNGIIDFFNNLIDGLDFSDIGTWLGETFAETVNGINWYGLGSFFSNLATGIWDLFGSALSTSFTKINWMDNIGALFSGLWGDDGQGLVKAIGTVGLIAGFKLLLSKTFSNQGLKDSAQSGFSGLFSGITPGQTITLSILTTVVASDTWKLINSIAENGWSVGIDMYFEENPNSSFNVTRKLTNAVTEALGDALNGFDVVSTEVFKKLWGYDTINTVLNTDPTGTPFYEKMWGLAKGLAKALGFELTDDGSNAVPASHKPSTMPTAPADDDPSGLSSAGGWLGKGFQKALDASKTLNTELDKAKTPRTVTVTDKNGGLKAGATNAVKMAGKNGLGGIKTSYSTTVKAGNLSTYTDKATTFKSTMGGIKPAYATKLTAAHLVAGATDASTLVGSKGLGGLKNKYSTTFTGANLATGAKDASSVKTNLNAINGKTYKATVKVDTENYANTKKKIDSLNTISEHTVRFKPIIDKSTTGSLISGSGNTANFTLKLDALAQGGFPQGDIFVANEQGPELIGTINGRNAVASNGEITGITEAVYETGEDEAALLREQNQLLRQLLAKDNRVMLAPNAAAGRWVNQAQRAYSLATGGV